MTWPDEVCAVVTDLDGTIVRADQTVSAATCRAVTELRARGVPLVVATARTPAGLAVLGPILPFVSLAVCCNGSLGYQPAEGRVLWREVIAASAVRGLVGTLTRDLPEAGFGVYSGSQWLLSPGYHAARGKRPSGPCQVVPASVAAGAPACAMGICHAGRSSADLAALLQAGDAGSAPVSFSYGASDVLDAVPHGIDKGTGLVRACDLTGLDPARAVGFGDALNDLPVFGVLGCAVAMANAQGEVRARADTTTGSVDDDGFAAHLARIGLVSNRHPV